MDFTQTIVEAYKIPQDLAAKIVRVAAHIGAHPYDLVNLIDFESGRTFRPDIEHPSTKAVGLIQFMRPTAVALGTSLSHLASLSAVDQLDWVAKYFDEIRGTRKLDTPYKLYMAVFYPAAMFWSPEKLFPSNVIAANTYQTKSGTVKIDSPSAYVDLANRWAKLPTSESAPSFVPNALITSATDISFAPQTDMLLESYGRRSSDNAGPTLLLGAAAVGCWFALTS